MPSVNPFTFFVEFGLRRLVKSESILHTDRNALEASLWPLSIRARNDTFGWSLIAAASRSLMSTLAEQLAEIPFFPPAIEVFPRLLPLLHSDNYSTGDLAEIVRVDGSLTADILRVCNSVAFGFKLRAHTIHEAIMRVGLRELYIITSKVIAAPILGAGSHDNFVEGVDLWHHSLATGAAASVLAHMKGIDREVAFTVGLLHDIGKVRLVQTVRRDYEQMILSSRTGVEPIYMLEARRWGIDHAVIGGQLLKNWSFPEPMRDALLLHHSVMGSTPHLEFAALIHLADYLAGAIGLPYDRYSPRFLPQPRALQLLGFTQEKVDQLCPTVLQLYTREQRAFTGTAED